MKDFGLYLEMDRTGRNMSQKEYAKCLGLSLSSYKRIINGESSVKSVELANKLYRLTGKFLFEFTDESTPTLELVKKLKGLNSRQLAFINSIVDFELKYADSSDAENMISVIVPTGEVGDGMIWDSCSIEKVNADSYIKKFGPALTHGVKVNSTNLVPVYNKDDILLISRKPIRNGDVGIFIRHEDGCAYLRKLEAGKPAALVPVNGYGETFYIDYDDPEDLSKWILYGIVLCKMR